MWVTDAQVKKMRRELDKDNNVNRAAMKAGMDRKTARRQIGSSIAFGSQTQQQVGREGEPSRPSGVLGRLRWRRAGVREGAVSAVGANF
jgi:hypothetical protein